MEPTISISCNVDSASVAALEAAMMRFHSEVGNSQKTAVRRGTIALLRSIRARTKMAPKKIPTSEYSACPSDKPPKYLFYSRGKKLSRPLHRWQLTRKRGTPDEYTKHHYVYTSAHRNKSGRMVGKNMRAEKSELLRVYGQIKNRGLARRSWGWAMHDLFGGKDEKRMPHSAVAAVSTRKRETKEEISVRVRNALNYIASAVSPGALSQALAAATNYINKQINAGIAKARAKEFGQ